MRRTVSSLENISQKFMALVCWNGICGYFAYRAWLGQLDVSLFPVLTVWVITSTFLAWHCRRWKRVQFDGKALYVSNYLSADVCIPITEVTGVALTPPLSGRGDCVITISLRGTSAVGECVQFIPKVASIWGSRLEIHPDVTELLTRLNQITSHPHSQSR